MRTFRGVLGLALLTSCGGAGGKAKGPVGPELKAGTHVKITDGGQIFDALNTTSCVKWPSADVKKRAGRDGWHDFVPNSGLEGTVVAALAHCDGKTQVVLVAVGDYVVPVTRKGVEVPGQNVVAPTPQPPAPPDPYYDDPYGYGGGYYGGYYGGGGGYGYDPYAGYYGGAYGGGGTIYPGDYVEITDTTAVYSDLNTSDCITWPSDDVKTRGGSSEWSGWTPSKGDTGYVLSSAYHCTTSTEVLILEMDSGYVVPIQASGVALK